VVLIGLETKTRSRDPHPWITHRLGQFADVTICTILYVDVRIYQIFISCDLLCEMGFNSITAGFSLAWNVKGQDVGEKLRNFLDGQGHQKISQKLGIHC